MLGVDAGSRTTALICARCGGELRIPDGDWSDEARCSACNAAYGFQDGVLVLSPEGSQEDYPDDLYRLLDATEPRHFWFPARNRVIVSALRESLGELAGRSVLEVGCGTGYVLQGLEAAGMRACGLDMHIEGLRFARERVSCLLVCEAAERVPFANQFDVVALCDVIEHVDDDVGLLRAAAGALKPGGSVLVTVPAQPSLWTHVDEAWGHKRRYSKRMLRESLTAAGLEPSLVRYFNVLLHPMHALQRKLIKPRPASSAEDARQVLTEEALRVPPAPVNAACALLLRADVPLGRTGLPMGSSLVAIAKLKG